MIDPEIRRQGIGCSQIAAVQGLSAFSTPWEIAYEKRGLLFPAEDEDGVAGWLRWGSDVEPAILKWYARERGKALLLDHRTRKHPELPLVYTPDALVEGERRGVDAKNVGWAHADEWRKGPPADAWFQVHGYMLCMDLDAYDLAVSICGEEPLIYTETRDAEVERVIARRVTNFWQRFVIGEEELPIDGSMAASAWLARRFPRHRKGTIRQANEEETELLEEYETTRIVQDEVKERRAELENQLKLAIGDGEGLAWPGGQFTWRTTKDRKITDWESMAIGLRNEYVKEPEKLELLESLYTREKKGYRRIHFKSLLYTESKQEDAAA